jgi:hypothetical protein
MRRIRQALAVSTLTLIAFASAGASLPAAAAGAATATTAPNVPSPKQHSATATSDSAIVKSVKLTVGSGTGAFRSYKATVLDADGNPITGAKLDIGGLGAEPDLRVKTTDMVVSPTDPTVYTAKIEYPSDGDFVLVVRVHEPSQAVELFTDNIVGAGAAPGHHDLTPSRSAVLKADPTFYRRYDPSKSATNAVSAPNTNSNLSAITAGSSGSGTDESLPHSHAGQEGSQRLTDGPVVTSTSSHAFDPNKVLTSLLHSAGAAAWMLAVLGLVFANRLGPGVARSALTELVSRNYALLAGLGLLTVTVTGAAKVVSSSAGLTDPRQLVESTLGTAYLAVFGFKMCLAIGSMALSWRIGRLLPTGRQIRTQGKLLSVGAHANTDLSAFEQSARAYRLAETNAMISGLIIACVAILEQLHFGLH